MILSIAGEPGAGKSTLRNLIAERLGYKKYSMGDMRGKLAVSLGLTIDQLNARGMNDESTDKDVDAYQTWLGEEEDDFVIEGRLCWYFIPRSFKVLLTVDPMVAATRVYESRKKHADERGDEPEYASPEEARRILADRSACDWLRYKKWYGLERLDPLKFDFVIDATSRSPEEIVDAVLQAAGAQMMAPPGR